MGIIPLFLTLKENNMKVTIYGKPQCLYCVRAIELCEDKGLEFDYLTVNEHITVEELTEKAKKLDTVKIVIN